jgi:hypothetical protein
MRRMRVVAGGAVLVLLSGCHAGARRIISNPASFPESDDTDEDLVAYAELCKQELGIEGPLPDMSCLAGTEVPITVNGQAVSETEFRALASERLGCDRAQWLDGACWTYDLVQRVEVDDDVDAVLNCRQKLFTSPLSPPARIRAYEAAVERDASEGERIRLWRSIFEFDDMGLILRNRRTGKTCFFTFFGKLDLERPERSFSFYGGWIPAPDQKTLAPRDDVYRLLPDPKPPRGYAETMWYRGPKGAPGKRPNMFFTPRSTAAGQCTSCHNHGAFKHSPFIDQALRGDEPIVPTNERDLPYLLVGHTFQESFRKAKVLEIDTEPVRGEVQACTACHRLTTGGKGADDRRNWAVGEAVPKPSYIASRFPGHAWMPFDHGLDSEVDYRRSFGPMIDAIRCCAKTPDAIGCRSRTIGPTEADVFLDERGRLSEGSWVRGENTSVPACVSVSASPSEARRDR